MLEVHDVTDYKVLLEFYDMPDREVIVKAKSRGAAATKVLKTIKQGNLKRLTPREVQS